MIKKIDSKKTKLSTKKIVKKVVKKSLLPKQFKKDWIKALRSKRYKQGTGWLHNETEYCCLGVACRILKVPIKKLTLITMPDEIDPLLQSKYNLPELLISKKKLDVKKVNKLVSMNDEENKSFEEIADYIEKNL